MSTAARNNRSPDPRCRRQRGLAALLAGGALLTLGGNTVAEPPAGALELIATHRLRITEPSDVAIDPTGTILWVVTNKPARVYQLDREGNVVKEVAYAGKDLEAIAYDPTDQTLWVSEERRRELVQLNLAGEVLGRVPVALASQKNSGIEGMCLDDRGRMFLLNEKRPGLFVELGPTGSIASQRELTFAKDYAGMAYDSRSSSFWIVSDQSQSLYQWDAVRGVLRAYPLACAKPEGVAVDIRSGRVYVVSDSENTLYVYRAAAAAVPR